MNTIEMKSDLHQFIENINDSHVLKAIHTLLKKQIAEEIVGYDPKGKPLTQKAFIKRIERAESEISKGNYSTLEDFEKESKNW